jgi:predicted dithiol-disulfide oxidoreductase (DUF899 family)
MQPHNIVSRQARAGLDMMNAAYHHLDLTPLDRHEEGLSYPMDWVRLRDQYTSAPVQASCCHS